MKTVFILHHTYERDEHEEAKLIGVYSTNVQAELAINRLKDNIWTTVQAECLPNNQYQIWELYDNDSLGEFKHLDTVECEEKDDGLFAVKLVSKAETLTRVLRQAG